MSNIVSELLNRLQNTSFPTCSNITNMADLKKSAAHPIMAVELKQK